MKKIDLPMPPHLCECGNVATIKVSGKELICERCRKIEKRYYGRGERHLKPALR